MQTGTQANPAKIRVLILEDSAPDAEIMVRELKRAGFEPEWRKVETESAFLDALAAEPDLILADYSLPHFDGLRAVRAVRERGLYIPFILVSGTVGEEIAVNTIKEGADDFLLKDRLARLGSAVANALENRRLRAERRIAEQRLRESEAKHRQLLDTVRHGIVESDLNGAISYCNAAYAAMLGYNDARELIGKPIGELVAPAERERFDNTYADVVRNRPSPTPYTATHLSREGREIIGQVDWNYLWDRDGSLTGLISIVTDITERKQAEEKLRANERMLQTLFDTLPVELAVKDADTRYQMVNRAWRERYGLALEQIIGKKSLEIPGRPEADRFFTFEQDRKALAADGTVTAESWLTVAGGEKRHFLSYRAPIRDESGKVTGLVGATIDSTELKRAEEEVRKSQRLLRTVFDTIPHLLVVKDAQSRYLMVNEAWSEASGISQEEALRLDPLSIPNRPLTEAIEFVEEDRQVVSGSQASISADRVLTLKNGAQRHFHSIKSPLRDENGNAIGVVAILVDFTAEKESRERADIAHARLFDAIESLPAAFQLYGPDERLVLWNSRVGEFFPDINAKLNVGMPLENVLRLAAGEVDEANGRTETWVRERLEQVRLGSRHYYEQRLADGRWLRGIDQRTSDGGTVALRFDITESKKREEELRQAQKMEAIGQLTGGIAHDFNNILAVIMSFSEMVLDRLEQGNPLHSDMKIILDAAGRAAALTRQLLAFGRRQMLRMDPADLNEIVTGMDKMLRRVIREDIDLRLHSSPDLPLIKADRGQIEQILMNLVVNARDAMPDGGMLTVETSSRDFIEEDVQQHGAVALGPHVMLVVTDTGTGMDKETQARIFEPFFTTKPVGSGTGLGLATVYGIVKQMGGTIWVYSELGKGTTFKIFFPVLPGQKTVTAPAESERLAEAAGSETILLVEDEESVREAARRILTGHGYTVHVAKNGNEAVDLLKTKGGEIDCILSDVVMPGMSTKELLEAVRKRTDVPIVFMSGYTDISIVNQGVLDGGTPFLHKPFTKRSLLDKMREVLPVKPAGGR